MTRDEVRALILSFPGAEDGVSYGEPSYKVCGKFFTRLRQEDDSLVVSGVSFDEREMLMDAEPATFHLTDHYRSYPSVLVRIGAVHPGTLRNLLGRRWRELAPKAAVRAFDAGRAVEGDSGPLAP